jgi:hypothetical protein
MSVLSQFSDPYDRRARLFPMTIVLLPLGLAAACWIPLDLQLLVTLGGIAVSIGLAALLSQIGRDLGKAKEPDLWKTWGGKPSMVALQYRSGRTNHVTLRRCHAKLKEMAPGLKFPSSKDEELQNISTFDVSYDSASDLLLSRTRDRTKFGLVFAENTNYGFRRNLCAMKPAGIVGCIIGVCSAIGHIGYLWVRSEVVSIPAAVCLVVSVTFLVLWMFRIRSQWVRTAAEAFARQLVRACDQM